MFVFLLQKAVWYYGRAPSLNCSGLKVGNRSSTSDIVYIDMTVKNVSLSAIQLIWKYQQANDNNVAVIAKKTTVILFYVRLLQCAEGKETFGSDKKKREAGEV